MWAGHLAGKGEVGGSTPLLTPNPEWSPQLPSLAPARGPADPVPWGAGRKEILQEYLEISSLVQEEVVAIHQEMAAAAARIQPAAEYQGFLRQYG